MVACKIDDSQVATASFRSRWAFARRTGRSNLAWQRGDKDKGDLWLLGAMKVMLRR
jgi:hypothetical protein